MALVTHDVGMDEAYCQSSACFGISGNSPRSKLRLSTEEDARQHADLLGHRVVCYISGTTTYDGAS